MDETTMSAQAKMLRLLREHEVIIWKIALGLKRKNQSFNPKWENGGSGVHS